MRLVHIVKATRIAGAERHLLTLLPGLAARGHEVHLLLLHNPGNRVDDMVQHLEASGGVAVQRLPIARHLAPGMVGTLRDRLRALRPDIAHTHLIHADVYGIPAARWAGVRRIVTTRHNDDPFRRSLAINVANRALWAMTSAGIAISEHIARFTVEIEGAPARKIHTIYYGLQPIAPEQRIDRREARASLAAELGIAPELPLLGMVCRLTEQKGVGYAIDALAGLTQEFPDAHLVIAGDGEQRAALERWAGAQGLRDRVHFLGWRAQTARVLAAIDLFLMPSLWEGFGLVMLEAMARGTPIIGSRVSAIPEVVIDGETGYLVPPRDPAALAGAAARLLRDPALLRHMGLMGEDRLETQFSADKMISETIALYEGG